MRLVGIGEYNTIYAVDDDGTRYTIANCSITKGNTNEVHGSCTSTFTAFPIKEALSPEAYSKLDDAAKKLGDMFNGND